MKKYIFILLVALSAIYCTEEKIPTYHGGHYISFTTDMSKDSTISSFFFYPNATSIEIPLTLQLGGGPLAEDHQYTLAVVEEESNALSKNYQLGTYTFRKGLVQDTAIVTLLKSAELTGQWERKLRMIENGTYRASDFLDELKSMVSKIVISVLSES